MSNEQLIASADKWLKEKEDSRNTHEALSVRYTLGKFDDTELVLISRLTTALKEAEDKQGWRPISEAPKLGQLLLSDGRMVWVGHWYRLGEPPRFTDDSSILYYCKNPTHFMPLPNPPVAEE